MYLGLDIGTTSICAVVLDANGEIVYTKTKENSFGCSKENGEQTQDPWKIEGVCKAIYDDVIRQFSIVSIGISGQMHGILYVDQNGNAISPLYSWQDERGKLPFQNATYTETVFKRSGCFAATGFGCVSMFYDFSNGLIPRETAAICTIGDYIAMRFAGVNAPLVHETNAASIGLYDLKEHCWNKAAILRVGLPYALFPNITQELKEIGKTKEGVSVFTAIGDNQSSVYGVTKSDDCLIVNIGTGSQVSVIVEEYCDVPVGCEIRPYFNGKYLILGCALCGGHSYRLLKDFFNSIFDGVEKITYEKMNEWAAIAWDQSLPIIKPLFRGTRRDPTLRAEISCLSESNFNVQALTLSVLKGMSKELKDFYDGIALITGERMELVASGNAIRNNIVLQKIIQEDYQKLLHIPTYKEEAAYGAALLAAEQKEHVGLKRFIRYQA